MKIRIVTVGKWSLKEARNLAELYLARIGHYFGIETVCVKSVSSGLEKVGTQDRLVLLEPQGRHFTSEELAQWLEKQKLRSVKNLLFFAGPAEGFSEEVKRKADFLLSLSKMTLQHELALVVLLEQIYRACTILKGEPYHKG